MTKRATFFAHYIQCLTLNVMAMMSSMNPPIGASVAVMSTARGSAYAIFLLNVVYPPLGVRFCVMS